MAKYGKNNYFDGVVLPEPKEEALRRMAKGVDASKGYLESTDAGLLFDGPRSMECFFNLRQSDGTQRPAQFSTSMIAIAVTPMDAIMFHCGNKSLQVSRVTIGDYIHAVISYDGATAMCYINGIEVGAMQPTAYTPSALFRIGDPLRITKSPIHFCRHFNYALSAEEVAAHYNNGDPAGYVVPLADKYRWEASESNIGNIRFYPNNEGSGVTSYLEDNANGFTGRYAHIIGGSSGLLSVYSYQFMGHPVGCVVEAKFKYRSNAPVRVLADNSSLPINMEDAADATLLHGDAVQHVGLLHGAAAVGDDDELGLIADAAQILGKPHHVGIVQGGFDLVQNAERSRVDR